MTSVFDASVRDVDFADLADNARIPVGDPADDSPAVTTKGSVTAGLKGDKGDKGDQGGIGNQGIQGIQGEEAEGGTVNLGSRRIADYWSGDVIIAVANRFAATGLVVPEDEQNGYWLVNLGNATATGGGPDADWHRIDAGQLFALPAAVSGANASIIAEGNNALVLSFEREGFSTVQFAHSGAGQLLVAYGVVHDFYNLQIRRELHTAFPVPPSNAIKLLENYIIPANWAQPSNTASGLPPDNVVPLTTALPNVPGKVYICGRQGAGLCAWYLDLDAETLYRGQSLGDQIKRTGLITGFSHVSICAKKGATDSELIFQSAFAASVGPADSRIDVWFEPSAAASPVPITIFEGDVSAQVAADRVLDLNFDLPSTGVLEFVGDTASLDVDPQLDTEGLDVIPLGTIRCSDLQRIPVMTDTQAVAASWASLPKIYLASRAIIDPGTTAESIVDSSSNSQAGLWVARVASDNMLPVKIGHDFQNSLGMKDLAPLIIRWIP